jgi:ferric-dicitrate binding protein FerR (iron transport regulator)
MSGSNDRIRYLFGQYTQKACTREELQELFTYIAQPENRAILEQMMDGEYAGLHAVPNTQEIDWEYMFQQATQTTAHTIYPLPGRNRFQWVRVAAAAVIVLALGLGGYWFINRLWGNKAVKNGQSVPMGKQDVQPGGNKAILTLSDGNTIVLDNAQNGLLAQQGNAKIIKQNDGALRYNREGGATSKPFTIDHSPLTYNMLATPRGGQYQLILPDGSKVWLNAASSIRYPTAFAGNSREVELDGEGYFEVAKDASKPFHVKTRAQDVEVLGTHFNVNAYSDEEAIKTTLLEGKVKVSSMVNGEWSMLKPGQQAMVSPSTGGGRGEVLTIDDNIDLDQAVAWKNGLTAFKSADIKSIMRQVARWYNVEVVYEGNIPPRKFTGGIARSARLSELLHLLEVSKVHFRLDGNRLIVMP